MKSIDSKDEGRREPTRVVTESLKTFTVFLWIILTSLLTRLLSTVLLQITDLLGALEH